MTKKPSASLVYTVLIGLLVLLILSTVLIWALSDKPTVSAEKGPVLPDDPDKRLFIEEGEGLVKDHKTVDTAILQDGLRDMGVLVTNEYYFTELVSFSRIKSFLGFDIGFTETSFMASYDGCVNAGLNFASITVTVDEDKKTVTLGVPACTILSVEVDTDTFKLYEEKQGFLNPASITDFNLSLSEMKENARAKALSKGLLERADENAEKMLRNFVSGLLDTSVYQIRIVRT